MRRPHGAVGAEPGLLTAHRPRRRNRWRRVNRPTSAISASNLKTAALEIGQDC